MPCQAREEDAASVHMCSMSEQSQPCQRAGVDGLVHRLRLQQHLDSVEGVPQQRHRDAAHGAPAAGPHAHASAACPLAYSLPASLNTAAAARNTSVAALRTHTHSCGSWQLNEHTAVMSQLKTQL